jgi:phytoene synthase
MTPSELSQECDQVLRRHAKSFRIASLFLPKSMREDASLAYAFCRLVDDTVDEAPCAELAKVELSALEDMVLGKSDPNDLVSAYVEMCTRRGIGLKPALDLIAGSVKMGPASQPRCASLTGSTPPTAVRS